MRPLVIFRRIFSGAAGEPPLSIAAIISICYESKKISPPISTLALILPLNYVNEPDCFTLKHETNIQNNVIKCKINIGSGATTKN